jgi:peptidoglycan/xylan/chitin deacetylase (PgdA/CDA1 family)
MKKEKWLFLCSLLILVILLSGCTPAKKPETAVPSPKVAGDVTSTADDKYKRGHNIPGKLYWAGSSQDKKIALTFDDGPEEHWTPKILEILKEKNIKATFFVIGEQVQRFPNMLRKIDAEGHIIGNHTYDHADLVKLDTGAVAREIEECASIIKNTIGKTPRLVRPPFGFHNENVDSVIYAKNEVIILWSVDTQDWQGVDSATVKNKVLPKMKNGFIVLQHDGVNPRLGGSVEALPDMIDNLKSQGYTFVTIPELLEIKPYQE